MKRIIFILFVLMSFCAVNAQTTYPTTFPSPKADSGFNQTGYIRPLILGHIVMGDTTIRPKYNGATRLWAHAGVDTAYWSWINTKWVKISSSGSGGGGSVVWGDITGDITNQNDLINYIDSIVNANGGVDSLYYRGGAAVDSFFYSKNGTEYFWYANPAEDRIIYGGIVTWTGTDLDYYVSACYFRKNGIYYLTNDTTVTLPSLSNPDSSRKDVFIVRVLSDTQAEITTITGTESANPVTPQIDGQTDLYLTDVTLNPNQATGLNDTLIVYDNLSAGEFEYRSSTGVTTNFSNTTNVWRVPYSVDVSAINNNDIIGFGTETQRNALDYLGLSFFIKLKAVMPNSNGMLVSLWNNGVQVSNEIGIPFNRTSLSYQGFSVPMTTFGMTNAYFDSVRFRYAGGGAGISGMYFDFIYFQGNMNPGGPSTGGNNKWVTQGTAITIDSVSIPNVYKISADTSLLATHHYVDSSILASGGGSTEYVVQGYGIKVDSALRVYTVRADTVVISSKEWFYDRIDSLVLAFDGTYLQISDTASMLSNYVRRVLAGTNVTVDNTNAQYPIVSASGGGSVTPAALTKTDDTNVTLTLGGTPATALLQATSIAAGWTGTLGISRGGTNNGSLGVTQGTVYYGDGSKIVGLAPGTLGYYLSARGAGADPIWANPSDTVTIRKSGPNLIHITSYNSGYNSSTVGSSSAASRGDSANLYIGLRAALSGTTGYSNIALGRAALKSNTTGSRNVAIGDSSFRGNTITGNDNVGLGSNTLKDITSGGQNVAVGVNALLTNIGGSDNIGIGSSAGNGPTTGNKNIYIGYAAHIKASTASWNIAIGDQSMAIGNTTSGNGNIGIGRAALGRISSGTRNFFVSGDIGTGSLQSGASITTGSDNIGIFSQALVAAQSQSISIGSGSASGSQGVSIGHDAGSASTGTNNTYIGPFAARQTGGSTSGYNVGIGHRALDGLTTGNENVEIAAHSSGSTVYLTSGSNNVVLGNNAAAPLVATASNQLWIGSNLINWISKSGNNYLINATGSQASTLTGSAALEVKSTTGGFMPPVMTSTQGSAISSPAEGLLIYVLDTNATFTSKGWWGYDGAAWQKLNN